MSLLLFDNYFRFKRLKRYTDRQQGGLSRSTEHILMRNIQIKQFVKLNCGLRKMRLVETK